VNPTQNSCLSQASFCPSARSCSTCARVMIGEPSWRRVSSTRLDDRLMHSPLARTRYKTMEVRDWGQHDPVLINIAHLLEQPERVLVRIRGGARCAQGRLGDRPNQRACTAKCRAVAPSRRRRLTERHERLAELLRLALRILGDR
jgi:hypothetical protein